MAGTLWLVGMMGAGKSTVGPRLAERLRRPFLDSDAAIERAEGRSIAEIFERDGEGAFRRLERTAIEGAAGRELVVALGGGAIAQPGARELLAASGTIVYLRARAEVLLARLGDGSTRPLLRDADPAERLARVEGLLAERAHAYESAGVVIDTDGSSVDEVVAEICERLGWTPP